MIENEWTWIRIDEKPDDLASFLSLTDGIYCREEVSFDRNELAQLVEGKHPLSGYFSVFPFLILKDGQPAGRFILTEYEEDPVIYLGYLDGFDDPDLWSFMLTTAEDFARERGKTKISGPVNASFWIGYRLKTKGYDLPPYTGEPAQKPYYRDHLLRNGFRQVETYLSTIYRPVPDDYEHPLMQRRYDRILGKGYRICPADPRFWDRDLRRVYRLLSDLYSDFPVFKFISEDDFCRYMQRMAPIIDFSMVLLAFRREEMVGFFIALPNYGNLVYRTDPIGRFRTILRLFSAKKKAKEYILLYLGAHRDHPGIGAALGYRMMEEIRRRKAKSIGALIRQGKVTEGLFEDLIERKIEYGLFAKDL